jgi:hypothetical protein
VALLLRQPATAALRPRQGARDRGRPCDPLPTAAAAQAPAGREERPLIVYSAIPFEAIATNAPAGLVGTITVGVYDPSDASVILAPTTAGITEPAPGTYRAVLTVSQAGSFMLRWAHDGQTAEEELNVVATPASDLAWLRDLLEDDPKQEIESVTGDGATRLFTLANPPTLPGTLTVTLDGAEQEQGIDYTLPDAQTVVFTDPPAAGAHVVLAYRRQTWGDDELGRYLAAAGSNWDEQLPRVYAAASMALDSLMTGAAAALDFGAAGERFELSTVFDRLARWRALIAVTLSDEAARPKTFEPVITNAENGSTQP